MESNKWEEGNNLKGFARNEEISSNERERETKSLETSVVSPEIRTRRALTTKYYAFQYCFTTSPSFALTGPMIHGGWLRINFFMRCKLELNSVQHISRKFYFHTVKLPFGSVFCSLYIWNMRNKTLFFCPINLSTLKVRRLWNRSFCTYSCTPFEPFRCLVGLSQFDFVFSKNTWLSFFQQIRYSTLCITSRVITTKHFLTESN